MALKNRFFLFCLIAFYSLGCNKMNYISCSHLAVKNVLGSPPTQNGYISYKDYMVEISFTTHTFSTENPIRGTNVLDSIRYEPTLAKLFKKDKKVYYIFHSFSDTATLVKMDSLHNFIDLKLTNEGIVDTGNFTDTIMYNTLYKVIDSSFVYEGNLIRNKNFYLTEMFHTCFNFFFEFKTKDNLNYAGTIAYANNNKEIEYIIKDVQVITPVQMNICKKLIEKVKDKW